MYEPLDCPEVRNALATGYPHPVREKIHICPVCGEVLAEGDLLYDFDGDYLCAGCAINRIEETYSTQEIAEALGIKHKEAEYCPEMEEN